MTTPLVLVIGAGPAGLSAAAELAAAGTRVTVLEARSRVGGRVHSLRDPGTEIPVELGAEFIHGDCPETLRLAHEGKVVIAQIPDSHFLATEGTLTPAPDFWRTVERVSLQLDRRFKDSRRPDLSFADYLEHSRLAPRDQRLLLQYARGFQAADPRRLSARSLAGGGAEADGHQYRILSGYDRVLQVLRSKLADARVRIHFSSPVTQILWGPRAVEARVSGRSPLRARAAVLALPLAILKETVIAFRPSLEDWEPSLRLLEIGQVWKIVTRWKTAFWSEKDFWKRRSTSGTESPVFFQSPGEAVPVWWTSSPAAAPLLTGWAGGPDARAILALSEEERMDHSLGSLSRILGVERRILDRRLEKTWLQDWSQDPFSLGAYPYCGVGGATAPLALRKPLKDTLYLAGDYLDPDHLGTVEGALASGRRAARQLLGHLR